MSPVAAICQTSSSSCVYFLFNYKYYTKILEIIEKSSRDKMLHFQRC